MTGSDLTFLVCGIIVTLAALIVWAISVAERSPLMARIQAEARRRLK